MSDFKLDLNKKQHEELYETITMMSNHRFYNTLYQFLGIDNILEGKHPELYKPTETYKELIHQEYVHDTVIKSIKEIRFTNNHGSGFIITNDERYHNDRHYSDLWTHHVFAMYALYKENIVTSDNVKWKVETVFRNNSKTVTYFYNNRLTNIRNDYIACLGKELIDLYLICDFLKIQRPDIYYFPEGESVNKWLTHCRAKMYPTKISNLLVGYAVKGCIRTLTLADIHKALVSGSLEVKEMSRIDDTESYTIELADLGIQTTPSHWIIDINNLNNPGYRKIMKFYQNMISSRLSDIIESDFPK